MRGRIFDRGRAERISAAGRTVAQRTPETLTVIRYRAQPTVATIARLASTAIFAYLVALAPPGHTPRPVLAPLTALLVVQVTLYQTLRSAVRRVVAVVAGVLVAVALSAVVGFTWWSLGITIVAALALGYLLRLGDTILEVPISAMLILSVSTTRGEAASGRIIETLIGTGAGLIAGVILAKPRVETAHDAIQDLCRKMADLLDEMAAGLQDGMSADSVSDWLARSRALATEIRRVDEAVRQAEESVVLNPRSLRLPAHAISLPAALATLEHSAITIRGISRTLADLERLGEDEISMRAPDERNSLASVLAELSAAVRDYGSLATQHDAQGRERAESELRRHLDAARDQRDRLSQVLAADPADRPVGWPLRGELVSHVDRLRNELQPEIAEPGRRGIGSRGLPARLGRMQQRLRARMGGVRDER
jgi:hypothetical protein